MSGFFGGESVASTVYASLADLQAAWPSPPDAMLAVVNAGAGTDAVLYVADAEEGWIQIGAGGGGGGVTTITADTTINVPADYATLAAAVAYVRGVVVLNGAAVTITIDDTETITDQLTFTDEHLPYLRIQGLGAGPTIDCAAFTASPIGPKGWIFMLNAEVGPLLGTFRATNEAAIFVLIALNSKATFGGLTAPLNLSDFAGQGVIAYGGEFNGASVTLATVGSASYAFALGVNASLYGCTTTGRISADACTAAIAGGSVTGSNQAILARQGALLSLSNAVDVNGYISAESGRVQGSIDTLTQVGSPSYLVAAIQAGSIQLRVASLVLDPASSVWLARSTDASQVGLQITAITNTSTGYYADVTGGGQVALSGGAASFTAGPSQALYVPTAAGLIIA